MKKKLFILVPLFVLIIAAVTPLTAFASVEPTGSVAYNVAKDYGLIKNSCVIYKSGNDYFMITFNANVKLGYKDGYLYGKALSDANKFTYKFNSSNVYAKPTQVGTGYILKSTGFTTVQTAGTLMYSDVDIYNVNDDSTGFADSVFLKRGTSQSATPNPSPEPTQNSKLTSTISSTILSPILSEVIAILPTLLPVLVAFIAIRKGLAFTLQMLRNV